FRVEVEQVYDIFVPLFFSLVGSVECDTTCPFLSRFIIQSRLAKHTYLCIYILTDVNTRTDSTVRYEDKTLDQNWLIGYTDRWTEWRLLDAQESGVPAHAACEDFWGLMIHELKRLQITTPFK